MNDRSERRRWYIGCGIATAVLALLSMGAGLPLPHNDDIVFSAAARTFAEYGEIRSTLTRDWLDWRPFYFYPPVAPVLVGTWLRFTGLSVPSLNGLYAGLIVLFGLSWAVILDRLGTRSVLLALSSVLAFATATVTAGYRPDAMGIALASTGMALALSRPALAMAAGGFLIGIAVLAAPGGVIFFAAYGGTALFLHVWQRSSWATPLLCLAGGAALALLALALLIRGDFSTLLSQIAEHGDHVVRRITRLKHLPVVAAYALVPALCLPVLIACARNAFRAGVAPGLIGFATMLGAALLVSLFVQVQFVSYVFHSALVLLLTLWVLGRGLQRSAMAVRALPLAACLLLILPNLPWIVFAAHRTNVQPGELATVRQAAFDALASGRRVLVDPFAYRAVFDAAPPETALDWNFSSPFPGNKPSGPAQVCGKGEVWVVAPHFMLKTFPGVFAVERFAWLTGDSRLIAFIRRQSHRFLFPERAWDIAVLDCTGGSGPSLSAASSPAIRLANPLPGPATAAR